MRFFGGWIFGPGIFGGFCWKSSGFFGFLTFGSIRSSPSIEIPSTPSPPPPPPWEHYSRQNSERCLVPRRILLLGINFDDDCHYWFCCIFFFVMKRSSLIHFDMADDTLRHGWTTSSSNKRSCSSLTYTLGFISFSVSIQLINYFRSHYTSLWWILKTLERGTGVIRRSRLTYSGWNNGLSWAL